MIESIDLSSGDKKTIRNDKKEVLNETNKSFDSLNGYKSPAIKLYLSENELLQRQDKII